MRFLAGILGFGVIGLVLVDVFNTIILARRTRHSFRIARIFYRMTWKPFAEVGRRIKSSERREAFLSIYGPLAFVLLMALWATGLIFAFALVQWAAAFQPANLPPDFRTDLYFSGTTLLTLETGGPRNAVSKYITVIEGGLGFSLLGLVIGYLPVFYQAFSKRELQISLLDARAGSPPSARELLRVEVSNSARIERYLELWEQWAAEVLENQLSFPMMAWFRSHHANQSWLTALTAVVDCAAVISLCAEGDLKTQAEFTFAMGRHGLVDIARILGLKPTAAEAERLSHEDFSDLKRTLEGASAPLRSENLSEDNLRDLRRMYEPYAGALSSYLMMALPQWAGVGNWRENWKAPGHQTREVPFAVSDPFRKRSGS